MSSKGISMEAKKIEVVKVLPEPKSIRNIPVFLGFANFYWQFIQGFYKIIAPFISMLKTIRSWDELVLSRNNGSRLAFNKNNNSKPASEKNNSKNEVHEFNISGNDI